MLDLETYVHQSAAPARRVPPSPRRHLDDLSARCEWSSAVDSLDTYPQAAAAAIGGVRAEMACSMITADGKRDGVRGSGSQRSRTIISSAPGSAPGA